MRHPLGAFSVLALVAFGLGTAACSSSGGSKPPYERQVEAWSCCADADGGNCDCGGRIKGTLVSIDCGATGRNTCPVTPCCVVQQQGEIWSCRCVPETETCPSGDGVYAVPQCPP